MCKYTYNDFKPMYSIIKKLTQFHDFDTHKSLFMLNKK